MICALRMKESLSLHRPDNRLMGCQIASQDTGGVDPLSIVGMLPQSCRRNPLSKKEKSEKESLFDRVETVKQMGLVGGVEELEELIELSQFPMTARPFGSVQQRAPPAFCRGCVWEKVGSCRLYRDEDSC